MKSEEWVVAGTFRPSSDPDRVGSRFILSPRLTFLRTASKTRTLVSYRLIHRYPISSFQARLGFFEPIRSFLFSSGTIGSMIFPDPLSSSVMSMGSFFERVPRCFLDMHVLRFSCLPPFLSLKPHSALIVDSFW